MTTTKATLRGPDDQRKFIKFIDDLRTKRKWAWLDVYDRCRGGKNNGFNRVVHQVLIQDKPADCTFLTFLTLLEALGLEAEIRPRPVAGKRVQRVSGAGDSPPSADSTGEGPEE